MILAVYVRARISTRIRESIRANICSRKTQNKLLKLETRQTQLYVIIMNIYVIDLVCDGLMKLKITTISAIIRIDI